ncbi:TRAP-type C4-dicarboxylate transport system, small permease component [Catalinimonas alkaloidigena]|uniref:TRAP-type C4-dicarboxylate transport system, small permease component n=1 Tax=Catalinimonas alkaloidigena TaxID=1075417 RepID=A0A1G9H7V2_9BACT|nr:TRAP transporter small permease [Catalinimonas alkaloidigena]SDL08932.1 TRAP-type C4-dicarboxylate transport system, small permease component [Catalinimonas alkaloidigena]
MKFRRHVDRVLGIVLVILMATMTINVLWQVASRYVVGRPSAFTDELARYLLIWVGTLGAAYAAGQRMHLAIDIVPQKASPAGKRRLSLIINSIVIVFALLVMVIGGINLVYITLYLDQHSPALGVPLGYVYAVLPLSGLLIIYYSVVSLMEAAFPAEHQGDMLDDDPEPVR